jgi:hypothetical protein
MVGSLHYLRSVETLNTYSESCRQGRAATRSPTGNG